jgi:hypothetical protein
MRSWIAMNDLVKAGMVRQVDLTNVASQFELNFGGNREPMPIPLNAETFY